MWNDFFLRMESLFCYGFYNFVYFVHKILSFYNFVLLAPSIELFLNVCLYILLIYVDKKWSMLHLSMLNFVSKIDI